MSFRSLSLLICLSLVLSGNLYAAAKKAKISLTGVMILGTHKTAMIQYNGQSLNVKIDDPLGQWQIKTISAREVILYSPKTKKTKVLTLLLPAANELAKIQANKKITTPKPVSNNEDKKSFKPRVINDKDIPEGHRRVRTPFGDVLVKNDKK
jgi:hypothetical protein